MPEEDYVSTYNEKIFPAFFKVLRLIDIRRPYALALLMIPLALTEPLDHKPDFTSALQAIV